MSEAQKRLQSLSDDFQRLQNDLKTVVDGRQKLESQQQENEGVQKEFAILGDDVGIYKLVGPVLVKQDRDEAVGAVNGRLKYIDKEITRAETQIKEIQENATKIKVEIYRMQNSLQQQQT